MARRPLHPMRMSAYHGASPGSRLATWRPGSPGPISVDQMSATLLVDRSRDLIRNNPHAVRGKNLIVGHTVGVGIVPRSQCSNQLVRETLTNLWDEWVDVADADGQQSFYGLQALAVGEMVEGGEALGRLRTRRLEDGLPVPLQIQMLPTEILPRDYQQPNGGNSVTQGIERDALGKRVAYWMHQQHPGEWTRLASYNLMPVRVAADDVFHLFNQTRIGQLRGLPWLATALTILHQVGQYMDAELLRKQTVAMLVGFVTRAANEGSNAADLQQRFGEVIEKLGEEIPAVSLEPGTVQYLNEGEDVKFTQPADVGGSFEPFLSANYRAVAASLGVIYEELTGDWSQTNDRSYRPNFNTFKRLCGQWQYNLAAFQMCRPVRNRFIQLAVASGALRVPKSVSDADLIRTTWHPQRFDYINYAQDIAATQAEIDAGLTSRSAVIVSRGDDPETVDRDRAADRQREIDLGITTTSAADPGSADQVTDSINQKGKDNGVFG